MLASEVPQELIDILDRLAGKAHSRTGTVVSALAEILTRYDEMKGCTMPRDGWQEMYYIAGRTDIDVMRTQATQALTHPKFPTETLIHFHEKHLPCDVYKHEEYTIKKDGNGES